ncbi:MAG TPA: hypothetical protein VIH05_08245 [Tepidiformaceae bacterium]
MDYPKGLAVWRLLTDEDEIDLFRVDGDSVLAPDVDGLGSVAVSPEAYDRLSSRLEDLLFVERAGINVREHDIDALAREHDRLTQAARKALQYRERGNRYRAPVVMLQKAIGETNPRYAVVHSIPQYENPSSLWTPAMAQQAAIENLEVSIARYIWRDQVPGQRGSPIRLTPLDSHPDDGALAWSFVGNHRQENGAISHIYRFDTTGGTFSANLVGTEHDLFDADPEVGDIYYIGFPPTEPGFHLAGRLVTAGVYSGLAWVLEYSDGAAGWPDFTLGSHYTRFPDDEMWNQLGPVLLGWSGYNGVNAWAAETVNAVSRLWVRLRVTGLTSMTTSPRIASDHMALRRPELEIPATSLRGRTSPYMMLRLKTPSGGDGSAGKIGNISRVIVGAKTENIGDGGFVSRINLGNAGNPAGIAVTYGTDTSAVANLRTPGGAAAQCTFATDTTMTMRCRVTLTDLLEALKGEYRVFLKCGQVGGVAGDDYVKLRAILISPTTYFPVQEFSEVRMASLAAAGNLDELVNLTPGGYLTVPFAEVDEADPSYATANLVLEVHAKGTAASDLFPFELILIPTNEWSCEYADPLSNPTNGSSALRGDSILEDDGGVIRDRTIKRLISEGVELGTDIWTRRGLPPRLEPGKVTRLYFLFGFFPSTGFGQVPLLAQPGIGVQAELYAHACYHFLRGDD